MLSRVKIGQIGSFLKQSLREAKLPQSSPDDDLSLRLCGQRACPHVTPKTPKGLAPRRALLRFFALGFLLSLLWTLPINAQSFTSHNRNLVERRAAQLWYEGKYDRAIALWQQQLASYRADGRTTKESETGLKISQGLISLGQYRSAMTQLNEVMSQKASSPLSRAKAEKLLADAHGGIGNYKKAILLYQSSLQKLASLDGKELAETKLSTLNNLVSVLQKRRQANQLKASFSSTEEDARSYHQQIQQDYDLALKYARLAKDLGKAKNSASVVRTLIEFNKLSSPLALGDIQKGSNIMMNLTPSSSTVLSMLEWSKVDQTNRLSWLYRANNMASAIDNERVQSTVLMELARFFETRRDLKQAIDYAKQSALKAEGSNTFDNLYRAQRLTAGLYREQGQSNKARDAYRSAIASVDLVAEDMRDRNRNQIVEFNRQIEPIYRETLSLLLDNSSPNLDEALLVFDKLRLAQLRRYFGDNCFEIDRPNITNRNNSTTKNVAIVNSIILTDKVVFILQLKDGRTIKSEANISQAQLENMAQQWYGELTTGFSWEFRALSRQFYDLIIRPYDAELSATQPEALVFIHDGILRNLPMAALYDGEQFLAEKWASVSSLGLNYTNSSTQPKDLKVAAFGTENFPNGWSKLPGVVEEIDSIQNTVGGKEFLGQEFTVDNLTRQLSNNEYSIVHLATHGYFGGTASSSFILAHDQKISANSLEDILGTSKQIPDLLVLSACETAVGSELAQLGLAGVGVRSGVASTLGSLWQVDDEDQSKTIKAFYSGLTDNGKSNKLARPTAKSALALQQIQIEQIRALAHPQQWAALNLIGDW